MTGISRHGAQNFREAVARQVGDEQVPGLVALVAAGEQVVVETGGTLSIGGAPVRRDTPFRIASTTKPITAAATMALVDEGLIGLDEPVQQLLPELADRRVLKRPDGPLGETVPAARPITARDLLTFTFGFGMAGEMFTAPAPWPVQSAAEELALATLGPPRPDTPPDPDTWIARFATLPLIAQPGERWLYNSGASVLGVLLARATGQSLAELMRTRLFEPLGMHDTAFWIAEAERLPTAYFPSPDGFTVWDPPDGEWSHPPAFGDGAAGLLSTVDDLLAFARMLLAGGGPVLSAESVRAMTSDQLTAEQRARGGLGPGFFDHRSWGFGQAVNDSGSFGWDGGLGCSWLVDPARELTVIVLSQRMFESPELPRAHREIQAAAFAAAA